MGRAEFVLLRFTERTEYTSNKGNRMSAGKERRSVSFNRPCGR